jgi:hypothetical protein
MGGVICTIGLHVLSACVDPGGNPKAGGGKGPSDKRARSDPGIQIFLRPHETQNKPLKKIEQGEQTKVQPEGH